MPEPADQAEFSSELFRAPGPRTLPWCQLLLALSRLATAGACHVDAPAAQLRADARRNIELILDAAEACLARDPDASMRDIAAEAGLGRVTIYGHFASRQVLIEAVARRMLAGANAPLDEIDLSGDAAGALERLIHATWQLILRSGSLLVAAEKALPAATVRQAHAGGLEERVRTSSLPPRPPPPFGRTYRPIG